jgi:hypothetical protein
MFELVYCSIAKPDLNPEDIQDILQKARDFNSKNKITGCLLFHNNEFLQILEGEKSVVQKLYESIKRDVRHSHVILLEEEENENMKRLFPQWSMAFHELHASEFVKNDFVKNFSTFSDLTKKPTNASDLFWTMAKLILAKTN